jgi:hypothetical protein
MASSNAKRMSARWNSALWLCSCRKTSCSLHHTVCLLTLTTPAIIWNIATSNSQAPTYIHPTGHTATPLIDNSSHRYTAIYCSMKATRTRKSRTYSATDVFVYSQS